MAITVQLTEVFVDWFERLRDHKARVRIQTRIDRLETGNVGDSKPVGSGVSELRIDYGPGYRLYFVRRGLEIFILLCGGDKSTQKRDIEAAIRLAKEYGQ